MVPDVAEGVLFVFIAFTSTKHLLSPQCGKFYCTLDVVVTERAPVWKWKETPHPVPLRWAVTGGCKFWAASASKLVNIMSMTVLFWSELKYKTLKLEFD